MVDLKEDLELTYSVEKRFIKARDMPSPAETQDLIASALNKSILDKLEENPSLDINKIRDSVMESFNTIMGPRYWVKSVLQTNGTVVLFVEGSETIDLEALMETTNARS